jgi:surfeit locus 1 family protein
MTARAKRRFRPTLWATVAVIPVFALLVGLGVWQLQRIKWKNALVEEMQGRMSAPAIELPQPLDAPEALRFRRVQLTGSYLHDKALYRAAQTLGKNRRGWHVIVPMRLADGRSILVNRGYVPTELKAPEARPESLREGTVTIEGVLRLGGWSGMDFVRPENDPADNVWVWMDLPRMAEAAGLENAMTQVYVDAAEGQHPAEYPVGGQTRVNLRNQHLEYALTWFMLAAGLLGIYVLYHWRPQAAARDEARS